jgi:hypothetical protein
MDILSHKFAECGNYKTYTMSVIHFTGHAETTSGDAPNKVEISQVKDNSPETAKLDTGMHNLVESW